MSREALKLALDALESAEPKYTRQRKDQKTLGGSLDYWKLAQHQRLKAITALREALNAPLAEQPAQQEPVFDCPRCGHCCPQRTWVGLTDEEIEEVWKQVESSDFGDCVHPFATAIEAKLRSKNEDRN